MQTQGTCMLHGSIGAARIMKTNPNEGGRRALPYAPGSRTRETRHHLGTANAAIRTIEHAIHTHGGDLEAVLNEKHKSQNYMCYMIHLTNKTAININIHVGKKWRNAHQNGRGLWSTLLFCDILFGSEWFMMKCNKYLPNQKK